MTKTRVTVLLSTFNGGRYLAEQLDSILSQTHTNLIVLARDDGSSDDTLGILTAYAARDARVRFFAGENIGFLNSFFTLLERADAGGYLAFADQDDVWLPNKLETAVAWLDAHDPAKPLLFHGAYAMADERLGHIRDVLPKKPPFSFARALTENVCSGFAMVVNGEMRRQMLRMDRGALDFHDWLAAAIAAGFGELCFDAHITALHRRLDSSVTADRAFKGFDWALDALKRDTNMKKRNIAFFAAYADRLGARERELLSLFTRFDAAARLKKAFYPYRWRYRLPDEIAVRLSMLRGTL